jgi:hypothetical protein
MIPVSRKSERIKINIRVSVSDEIARCLGLGFGSASSARLATARVALNAPMLARCAERQDYCNALP